MFKKFKRIKWYIRWKNKEITIFKSPKKGMYAWEMQIGPYVFHWMHPGKIFKNTKGIGKFRFWIDSAWIF